MKGRRRSFWLGLRWMYSSPVPREMPLDEKIVAHPSTKVDLVATISIVVESYSAVEHPVVFEEITTFSVHAKAEAAAVVVVDAEVRERGIDIVGVLLKLCACTDGEAHEEEQESEDFYKNRL